VKKDFLGIEKEVSGKKILGLASKNAPVEPKGPYLYYCLLAQMLNLMPSAGIALSTDRILRLQRLLPQIPADLPVEIFKFWIVPLFASDALQQTRFHQLFDEAVRDLHQTISPEPRLKENSSNKKRLAKPQMKASSSKSLKSVSARQDSLLSVDLEQCTEPPYVWSIGSDDPIRIAEGTDHNRTISRLRSREASELQYLDWASTLRDTIAQAGMPALRYRSHTRPIEYLILIERNAKDDHRALLFDYIYRQLRQQEVLIERFFHDGDPRSCFNETHPAGIPLRELRYRHADARLLLVGSGYRLLSAASGKSSAWVRTDLAAWKSRLLLTPVSREQWGIREFNLKHLFFLLPASWQSLHYVAEHLKPDPATRYADLPDGVRATAEWPKVILEVPYLDGLQEALPSFLLPWVAACAIWPELHFELTLRLGRLLSDENLNLLQLEYITRLTTLPWFANGFIPKDARRELLEYAEREHPGLLQRCAAHLLELLRQNMPDNPRSIAAAEYILYIALFEAMAQPDPTPGAMQRLRTVLKRLHRNSELTDFVLPPSIAEKLKLPEPGFEDTSPPFDAISLPGIKRVKIDPQLNPNYTFENFIEGDSNRLARNAGLAVAKKPGSTAFNPLIIFGDVGLGKTHLVQAIGNYIMAEGDSKAVIYVSSDKFTNQIIQAIKNKSITDFVNFYQMIDVFIMDDIQFLSGKPKMLEITFHILNQLHQNGKQIIMTCCPAPKDFKDIVERLIEPFRWGLSADLQAPNLEMRKAILKAKMEGEDLNIPIDVLEFICNNIKNNIRELEGVMVSLLAQSILMNRDVDMELAKEVISNFVKTINKEITVEYIQQIVAEFFSLPVEKLHQKSRRRNIAIPRQLSMYLARRLTNQSLKSIGKQFGGRDAKTVIYSCRAIQDMMDTDLIFKEVVEEVEKKFEYLG